MLQLAGCISRVAIRHLAPLSTDEDLETGVLLCGSGHGRLRLRAFHALLGGGLLAFEWRGVAQTLSSIPESAPSTWVPRGGGLKTAKKLTHALQIITGWFNDPHSAININNAQRIVHKTKTH